MSIQSMITAAALALLVSCGNGTNSKNQHDSIASPSNFVSHQFDGVFADTLPCADCSGIITHLNLESDSTFILEQEYVGLKEGDRAFYQLGRWSLVDSLLRLNEISEGPRQFKIVNTDELKMLDNEGVIITGTNLNYTLRRQHTAFVAKKPFTVRGVATDADTNSLFKICAWHKEVPLRLTASTIYPDSLAGLKEALKKGALVEAEGRFSTLDSAGKTFQVFTADKFLRYLPGEKCKD